ncbi:cytochrome P450 monooxygenase [Roridomyces roridus]|uniref:Cytochrome P450 monooxygenase n=1 Tax=Roridomyces roridus TaxID=1738132 RepID=A0AAD7B522_9AGAR|nr:cytochrome P450 monooxygenase [Roridomyces roridus]
MSSFLTPYTLLLPLALVVLIVLSHVLLFVIDPYGIRKHPGPVIARYSHIWLAVISQRGHRSEVIHAMHKRYGPFLRISPTEVSIADPEALAIIYAHGSGALKSDFYGPFVNITRGVMNTRDRKQHTRKRKIVSHIFSQRNVLEFEPHIRTYVRQLMGQWDRLCDAALKGLAGEDGEGWFGRGGRLWLDALPWLNYLAFDIIGDLAFGAPFGMVAAAKDIAPVPADPSALSDVAFTNPDVIHIPGVAVLNGRGEYSMCMGVLPAWWRPLAVRIPWFSARLQNVRQLAGISIVAVAKRLEVQTDRVDLLSRLIAGRDDEGKPMGRSEITAEALTFLVAGSDTTSNSTCAVLYYLAANPKVQARLQAELDEHIGTGEEVIATSEQVKHLVYLDACINEALRLHSTSSLGLPRVVPEEGLTVCGHFFPAGCVLSVPSYTIHRDSDVWGTDPEVYRPERWFEQDKVGGMQRTFNPYSVGPRACVGRNLAALELSIIIASLMRSFDFVLESPGEPLETREGFLRKPVRCRVGIERRAV